MDTMTDVDVVVTGGVDTHKDLHVAAALDQFGRLLGTEEFPTNSAGYRICTPGSPASAPSRASASRGRALGAQA